MMKRLGIAALSACVLAGVSGPAAAQKAKNTVRVGLFEPVISLILYDAPNPEAGTFSRALFDPLLCFDNRTREFMPNLARTWKWVDDQTIEMELQTGVKFHDGSEFDADDVTYTLNWLISPNNGLRFAENFNMIKSVEKVDQYKVRIHTHGPAPTALLRLSSSIVMVPSDTHSKLENKGDFGRKNPIGTGPFKLESFTNDKIVLVRNTDHKHGSVCKPSAEIDRLEATVMPDAQTQIANLATGNIDFMKVNDKAQADMLAKSPALKLTANPGFTYQFMSFDVANRAGNEALSNKKVRQAMIQSLNRQLIATSVTPGKDAVKAPDSLCQDFQRDCAYSSKPPAYDVKAAKQLLIEAGYPDGFDVELSATPGSQGLAEAVAGELRKIGVRAKVDRITWAGYRDKQRQGKLQVLISLWTSGGLADASSPLGFHFAPGPRDYARDKQIHAWIKEGMATIDDNKRKAIYEKAYNYVNSEVYTIPLSTKPDVFVHNKDLTLMKTAGGVYGLDYYEVTWKK